MEARLPTNIFIRRCKNQVAAEPLNEFISFINFNGGLMRLRRKNEHSKDYDMSGREKTIKTLNKVENVTNLSNHNSKGSRSIFARQPDMLLHCKQSCKARFKNDRDLG